MSNIARAFDRAASGYDRAASVQAQVAAHLMQKAANQKPTAILDIGSGTGFASEAAARRWPQAHITAIDVAPAMLKEAQRKVPHLRSITGDIANKHFGREFDLILSSMALHWLPQPRTVLENWRRWLTPRGHLFVATLAEGSFKEWHDLCASAGLTDGLQILPREDFANDLTVERQTIAVNYPTAKDFVLCLKATGAAQPRPGHKPFNISTMRELLAQAPQPFTISYRVLYILAPSPDSI